MRASTIGLGCLILGVASSGCSSVGVGPADADTHATDATPSPDGSTASALVSCDCGGTPVNLDNPVCGCRTAPAGTIGAGPDIESMDTDGYTCGFVDAAHNRLVMGVSGTTDTAAPRGLWAVDLATGARSLLSGTSTGAGTAMMGSGPAMSPITAVHPGSDGWYVLENLPSAAVLWAQPMVQRVDPATGNRTTVLDGPLFLHAGPPANGHPIDCGFSHFDTSYVRPSAGFGVATNGVLYFSAAMGAGDGTTSLSGYEAILAVTPGTTPTCRVVSATGSTSSGGSSTPSRGAGPSVAGFDALDLVDGVLWAYDAVGGALLRIDPTTGDRRVVSSPTNGHSVGHDVDTTNTCWPQTTGGANVFAVSGGSAWLGSDGGSNGGTVLTRVDLASGDRACIGGTYTNASGSYPYPVASSHIDSSVGIWVHPTSPLMLTAGANIIQVIDTVHQNANVLSN